MGILDARPSGHGRSVTNRKLSLPTFQQEAYPSLMIYEIQSPIESLLTPAPSSYPPTTTTTPNSIPLHAKSYLTNDPALIILYTHLRALTLQTLRGASQIPPLTEWSFILRTARLYDRMGCDLLALDLIRHWEFLKGPPEPKAAKDVEGVLGEGGVDFRGMLRRRSSLVVADLPVPLPVSGESGQKEKEGEKEKTKAKPPPTTFTEPDANSLLDSFGF